MVTNNPEPGVQDRTATPQAGTARQQTPGAAQGDALRVLDLSKSFRSGFLRRPIRGIDGVSFTVPRGTLFGLLGHNGAGKTTTINCLLDLVHPDRGEVNILGAAHGNCAVRARVGYLPERPYFFEHLNGRELLHFYAKLQGVEARDRKRRIDRLAVKLGIERYLDRRLKKYSKGMLQRIGIAQALLGDPELVILDEPMSGLDPMGRREIRELLLEMKAQGRTIILSSHIVPDVEQVADTVGILREGRLVLTRDLDDLRSASRFEIHLSGDWRTMRRRCRSCWPVARAKGAPCRGSRQRAPAWRISTSGPTMSAAHRRRIDHGQHLHAGDQHLPGDGP